MNDEILPHVFEAIIIASILGTAGLAWRTFLAGRERDRKMDQIIAFHVGAPANPITGAPQLPGLAAQLVTIKAELQRNGGSTVKDAVIRTEDTVNAVEAKVDRVQMMLSEHLAFGEVVMEVGIGNDDKIVDALRQLGAVMPDLDPYPDIEHHNDEDDTP